MSSFDQIRGVSSATSNNFNVSEKLNKLGNQLKLKELGKDIAELAKSGIKATINAFRGIGELFKSNSKESSGMIGAFSQLTNEILSINPRNIKKDKTSIQNSVPYFPHNNYSNEDSHNYYTENHSKNKRQKKAPEKQEVKNPKYDHRKIKSLPFAINEKTNVTLCRRTSFLNTKEKFGYSIFRAASAKKAEKKYLHLEKEGFATLIRAKTRDKMIKNIQSSKEKIFDLIINSNTKNGKKHGHSAEAFKSTTDGKIYVLDPYVRWKENEKGQKVASQDPIPLEKYPWDIEFAVPINKNLSLMASVNNKKLGYKEV